MRICVYGAASPTIDPEYIRLVEIMGEKMANRGHSLVFGGGGNGLMGAAARGVKKGGIGTYEEFFEILTLKQLCRHNKPIAMYNINGYYNEIVETISAASRKNFIRENCMELFYLSDNLDEIFQYIETLPRTDLTVKDLKDG